ncbi:MAG TPA: SNF2-related protein, partial [Pseudonocardiaceae bacterium]
YYGAPPDDKSIDLTAFESPLLWPMLDEADAIGLTLVHSRKRLGPLEKYGSAELCLDVTRDEGSGALTIDALLRVAGTRLDAGAIGFIGSTGHGVVYLDRAEVRASPDHTNWRLRLAKLVRPVPSTLRRMAVDNRRLEIPATEDHRFRDDYYPRLRHTATVISSDESFAPPAISAPTLVFHVAYGDGHELQTGWDWAYQVGEERRRAPLGTGESEDGYRDLDAEHEILANLDVPFDHIDLTRADPTRSPSARFRGIDTMRLTTELLPLLADRPGIDVEVTGDAADYREASDTLRIAVSTDAVADDRDWFDLGVTVTVEGHDVPFTDLFVALAAGQSHLLLADGAYFSLDKPELRSLRTLIEEARALHDWAGDSLRISRFQAGLWDELTELGIVHHQATAWQRQVQGLLAIDSLAPTPVPSTLDATLRPYQVDGFRWLAFLWECQLGGILADDMGLGKTLQTLALICHAQPADAPFLIVAPTSVVSNWATESARFAPGLRVVALSDTVRRRGQALSESIAGADVVVTSYTLFRLDFDAYAELPWSGLVLDEAQQ